MILPDNPSRRVWAWLHLLALGASVIATAHRAAAADPIPDSFVIPVLLIHYFPTTNDQIDISVTGDWGETLASTREKTRRQTIEIIEALQTGSRYRGFQSPQSRAGLQYQIVGSSEFLEPLPVRARPDNNVPMTDYKAIVQRIGIQEWVEKRGVKEVWIWGYHGGKVHLWESNMASRFGDVSNSDRNSDDLPVLSKTYTVYHYNYQRGTSEAVENHMHQIEAVLNHIDGRDTSPPERWPNLLFWGRFVGSDHSHRIVQPGCGWAHYPPNGERDYDWANPRFVETDMDDWKPDGNGIKRRMNSDPWGGDSLRWFIYWMQHLPGPDNGLTFRGVKLSNWWVFIGDYDFAKERQLGLTD